MSCAVGVGDPGDVVPCGELAPYEATRWGYGPGSEGMQLCSHHAWHAIDDGAEVTGPQGLPCRIDEDGELYEAQS